MLEGPPLLEIRPIWGVIRVEGEGEGERGGLGFGPWGVIWIRISQIEIGGLGVENSRGPTEGVENSRDLGDKRGRILGGERSKNGGNWG